MKNILKFFVILIAIITLVGCGKEEKTITPTPEEKPASTKADEKIACLKLVKEAKKELEENNIGPFSQAICERYSLSTTVFLEDYDNHVYLVYASKDSTTNEEKIDSYNMYNNSVVYDKGLCEDEESLGSLESTTCFLSKTIRSKYEEKYPQAKDETVISNEFY